ncbi:hypothetical protein DdX_10995 [Ditylenchus destructor]|uniref:Uncharacterized protein n=1 Tax=Ditylenchus destructor TaxID=166010 RepID=A0AAD4N362_9BILA|nr:hypothetical protein DdX_10995 [Ditylenchus destructor]
MGNHDNGRQDVNITRSANYLKMILVLKVSLIWICCWFSPCQCRPYISDAPSNAISMDVQNKSDKFSGRAKSIKSEEFEWENLLF